MIILIFKLFYYKKKVNTENKSVYKEQFRKIKSRKLVQVENNILL